MFGQIIENVTGAIENSSAPDLNAADLLEDLQEMLPSSEQVGEAVADTLDFGDIWNNAGEAIASIPDISNPDTRKDLAKDGINLLDDINQEGTVIDVLLPLPVDFAIDYAKIVLDPEVLKKDEDGKYAGHDWFLYFDWGVHWSIDDEKWEEGNA